MVKRILVMSLTRMGDLVQATPLIGGLRDKYPEAGITLMVSSDFAGFAPNIAGIDDSIVMDVRQFTHKEKWQNFSWVVIYRYLEQFLADVKKRDFDMVVNLSHSRLSALMILYLGIKNVCGFHCNETGDRRTHHPWMQYFGIELFSRIYNPFNLVEIFTRSGDVRPEEQKLRILVSGGVESSANEIIERENIGRDELLIGIQAGSSLEGRRWPARSFAELADMLIEKMDARIVLFGVLSESPLAAEILAAAKRKERIVDLTGKTDIPQLIGLVDRCDYLVTNDTGTMHIAAALGTTIVGLFFAHAHPFETGPYSPGHLLFQARISCAPCSYGVECNNVVCIEKVQPFHLCSMMQGHQKEGVWRLPKGMGALGELNIFETRYGADNRLALRPLVRHPLGLDDIFRCAYTKLWLNTLGETGGYGNSSGEDEIASILRQDYDCVKTQGVLYSLRVKMDALKDLIRLSRKGEQTAENLIRLCRGKVTVEKVQALGEEITRIDDQMELLGCSHPEVKPIVDIFSKRKENFQGDNVGRLAGETLKCYEKMEEEAEKMTGLLIPVLESLEDSACLNDQVAAGTINALVPCR